MMKPNETAQGNDPGPSVVSTRKKHHTWWLPLAVLLIVAVLLSACSRGNDYGGDDDDDRPRPRQSTEQEKTTEYAHPVVETLDAKKYFEENATIVDIVEIEEADTMLSEAEAYSLLKDRGFLQSTPVYYDSNGSLFNAIEITDDSENKHPIYETSYVTADGLYWVIIIVNNTVMANPVSYNLQSGKPAATVVIEKDYTTSYDAVSQSFYNTIPSESLMITKQISFIDSETLEKLTMEEIAK